MPEHTPGPWTLGSFDGNPAYVSVYGPNDELVADVHADEFDENEAEANARLIAAAPDLLAACEALVDGRQETNTDYTGLNRCCLLCDAWANRESAIVHTTDCPVGMAQKAIARAKGETDALSTDS